MRGRKVKRGDLVEMQWLDAAYYTDWNEEAEEAAQRGGEICILVGIVAGVTKTTVALVGELDSDRVPARDFNVIPRSLVKHIKILKRGQLAD